MHILTADNDTDDRTLLFKAASVVNGVVSFIMTAAITDFLNSVLNSASTSFTGKVRATMNLTDLPVVIVSNDLPVAKLLCRSHDYLKCYGTPARIQ